MVQQGTEERVRAALENPEASTLTRKWGQVECVLYFYRGYPKARSKTRKSARSFVPSLLNPKP
jgi:hypothetical protein